VGSTSGHDAGGDTYDALQRSLLLLVATNALRGAAAPGQYDAMVNGQALAEAMDAAYLQAKARTHPVDKFGYQLGGCAAVMLIQDAGAVFPGRMPDPGPPLGTVAYRGYLAGAAFSLAMAVTEAFQDVILPVWSQPDVRDHFLDLVDEIVADPDYPPRAAITSVVNCLRQFREADEQLAAPPPETMTAPADRSRPRSIPAADRHYRPGHGGGARAAAVDDSDHPVRIPAGRPHRHRSRASAGRPHSASARRPDHRVAGPAAAEHEGAAVRPGRRSEPGPGRTDRAGGAPPGQCSGVADQRPDGLSAVAVDPRPAPAA